VEVVDIVDVTDVGTVLVTIDVEPVKRKNVTPKCSYILASAYRFTKTVTSGEL